MEMAWEVEKLIPGKPEPILLTIVLHHNAYIHQRTIKTPSTMTHKLPCARHLRPTPAEPLAPSLLHLDTGTYRIPIEVQAPPIPEIRAVD